MRLEVGSVKWSTLEVPGLDKRLKALESTVQSKLDSLQALLEYQHHAQMMQGALAILNTCKGDTRGCFTYYNSSGESYSSWALVSDIIANSLRGYTYCVEGRYANTSDGLDQQAFRDALSCQVEGLTGVEPSFFEDDDGDVCIEIPWP